jgi:hypothetical protein
MHAPPLCPPSLPTRAALVPARRVAQWWRLRRARRLAMSQLAAQWLGRHPPRCGSAQARGAFPRQHALPRPLVSAPCPAASSQAFRLCDGRVLQCHVQPASAAARTVATAHRALAGTRTSLRRVRTHLLKQQPRTLQIHAVAAEALLLRVDGAGLSPRTRLEAGHIRTQLDNVLLRGLRSGQSVRTRSLSKRYLKHELGLGPRRLHLLGALEVA